VTTEASLPGKSELGLDLPVPAPIEDVWEVGPQIVATIPDRDDEGDAYDRRIRITATRSLPEGPYWAGYEEQFWSIIAGERRAVWARAGFPPARGESAEECLRKALEAVADAGRASA
jgi:hypothetical protein